VRLTLRQLAITNLLLQGVARAIDINIEARLLEDSRNLLGIVEEAHADGDDKDLARRQPEGPLAGEVLAQNGREALDRASHGAVDHDRASAARGQRLLGDERLLLAVLLVGSVLLLLAVDGGLGLLGLGLLLLLLLVLLGGGLRALGSLVLQGEVDGLLEVELDGGALPGALSRGLVCGLAESKRGYRTLRQSSTAISILGP